MIGSSVLIALVNGTTVLTALVTGSNDLAYETTFSTCGTATVRAIAAGVAMKAGAAMAAGAQ